MTSVEEKVPGMNDQKAIDELAFDPYCVLYLPLWRLDSGSFCSGDMYGKLCSRHGAGWTRYGWQFVSGEADYIDCDTYDILDCLPVTVIVWIRILSIGAWQRIIAFPKGFIHDWVIGLTDAEDGSFGVRLAADGHENSKLSSVPLSVSSMQMIAFTHDGNDARLFVNDSEAELGEIPGGDPDNLWWSSNNGSVQICANSTGLQNLSAVIPCVFILRRCASPAELFRFFRIGSGLLV